MFSRVSYILHTSAEHPLNKPFLQTERNLYDTDILESIQKDIAVWFENGFAQIYWSEDDIKEMHKESKKLLDIDQAKKIIDGCREIYNLYWKVQREVIDSAKKPLTKREIAILYDRYISLFRRLLWYFIAMGDKLTYAVEKELEKIKTPTSKLGDIYELGTHRLICGDSTDPEVVKKLMNGKKANTIFTDPPFNISLDYNKGIGGKGNYGGTVNDAKSDTEYKEFLKAALQNALTVLEKDAHIFTYCDQKYVWLLQTLYAELGVSNKRVCLWIKNNSTPTPQVAFNKQYEPCVYGTTGKPYLSEKILNFSEVLNKEIGTGNRTLEDILDLIDIWMVKRLSGANYEHPTEKPPQLHEKALRRCTKPGQIVLDCFAGSGSLLVACEQLKRSAYLVEREPIFIDLIIRRYEKLTGNKTKKVN